MQNAEPKSEGFQPKDIIASCLAVFMGLALLPLAPKLGRELTGVVLALMLVTAIYPIRHFAISRGKGSSARKIVRFIALMSVAILTEGAFGIYVWPPLRRHELSEKERYKFEESLSAQKSPRDTVRLVCPRADESACAYAGQFISLFREAGWTVLGNQIERGTLARPESGVILLLPGSGNLDSAKWNSGLLTVVSSSLENVRQAFVNVEVEPGYSADSRIPDRMMAVYFGPEKDDAAERTDLTKAMEEIEHFRKKSGIPTLP
jgi:hypothetical protein